MSKDSIDVCLAPADRAWRAAHELGCDPPVNVVDLAGFVSPLNPEARFQTKTESGDPSRSKGASRATNGQDSATLPPLRLTGECRQCDSPGHIAPH
jgi:hypothetical protein